MEHGIVRQLWRIGAVVCALGGSARSSPALPSGPVYLNDGAGTPNVLAYPAKRASTAPRPPVVMLHGMCDEPEWECPHFASASAAHGFLVCPRANLRCERGGSIWSGDRRFEASIEASIARVAAEWPDHVDAEAGRTLIGFSLGAIRAVELANRGGGKWKSVIAIGAKVHPNPKRLREAGVERIVLAAGDRDMMKWHMVGEAKKLARAGFPVAFMSLGPVGHTFPRDLGARMQKALAWAHGDSAAFVPEGRGELAFEP